MGKDKIEKIICMCGMTKVEMTDKILKTVGVKKGKSKYSDGVFTKKELFYIYKYLNNKKGKGNVKD